MAVAFDLAYVGRTHRCVADSHIAAGREQQIRSHWFEPRDRRFTAAHARTEELVYPCLLVPDLLLPGFMGRLCKRNVDCDGEEQIYRQILRIESAHEPRCIQGLYKHLTFIAHREIHLLEFVFCGPLSSLHDNGLCARLAEPVGQSSQRDPHTRIRYRHLPGHDRRSMPRGIACVRSGCDHPASVCGCLRRVRGGSPGFAPGFLSELVSRLSCSSLRSSNKTRKRIVAHIAVVFSRPRFMYVASGGIETNPARRLFRGSQSFQAQHPSGGGWFTEAA